MRAPKAIFKEMLRDRPHVDCYNFHHYLKDRHVPWNEEDRACPPLGRWNALMNEIEEYVKENENGD